MLVNTNVADPWTQTINLLYSWEPWNIAGKDVPGLRQNERYTQDRSCALVTLIDRPTGSTATIAWRDPTRGRFGDQIWRMARARASGLCAMSGRPILPGDVVYKPNPRPVPVNADAMILASVLENAAPL